MTTQFQFTKIKINIKIIIEEFNYFSIFFTMVKYKQPIRKIIKKELNIDSEKEEEISCGTSKLEVYFMNYFLDKLGLNYTYQYKAESIGRFYDFFLPEHRLIIEIDGDYWHSNPNKFKKLNRTQKRNRQVDEIKNNWAKLNCIKMLRIWESDIKNDPKKVFDLIKNNLKIK